MYVQRGEWIVRLRNEFHPGLRKSYGIVTWNIVGLRQSLLTIARDGLKICFMITRRALTTLVAALTASLVLPAGASFAQEQDAPDTTITTTTAAAAGTDLSNTVLFGVFGDLPTDAEGFVSAEALQAVGVSQTDINNAMFAGTGEWTNSEVEVHPGDFEILEVGPSEDWWAGPGESTDQYTGTYKLLHTWRDYTGRTLAARVGYYAPATGAGWGYAKYTRKHNLTSRAVKAATRYTNRRGTDGTTATYMTAVAQVKCSGWGFFRKCRVGNRTNVRTIHQNRTHNDGKPRGVITSYCTPNGGLWRCPDYVKKAANI